MADLSRDDIRAMLTTLTTGDRIVMSFTMAGLGRCQWNGSVQTVDTTAKTARVVFDEDKERVYNLPPGDTIIVHALQRRDPVALGTVMPSVLSFTPHLPTTWSLYIEGTATDRELLVMKLAKHFGISSEDELLVMGREDKVVEFDKAAMFESISRWISMAGDLSSWRTPALLNLITPLLDRLTELNVRRLKGPKFVTQYKKELNALDQELMKKDPRTVAYRKVMLQE